MPRRMPGDDDLGLALVKLVSGDVDDDVILPDPDMLPAVWPPPLCFVEKAQALIEKIEAEQG